MSSIDRQYLRDVAIPFKYVKPRLALGIAFVILVTWPWFIAHPESFSASSYHGPGASIDTMIASLPPSGRVLSSIVLEIYFLYTVLATYMPCLMYTSLNVFDGKNIVGLDVWGRKRAVLLSTVQRVSSRNGSLILSSPECRLKIPLSLLDVSDDQTRALRSILNDATG